MNLWLNDLDDPACDPVFDPLCVERSAPLSDEEAAEIEALCHAATPGPLVLDDQAAGEGVAVASLPDGRVIVSLSAGMGQGGLPEELEANAHLICKARYLLLRLLRDRRRWQEERECLLIRIGNPGPAPARRETRGARSDPRRKSRPVSRPR